MTSTTDPAVPRLECRQLCKTFVSTPALVNLNLRLHPGEVYALLGQNGSGKSTLIKVLSGYHRPDPGAEVRINGHDLHFGSPAAAAELGCRFVHQDLALIESLSVLDNLSIGSRYPSAFGTIQPRRARRDVAEALKRLDLDIDPGKLVSDLSPAMRSGVAIARALRGDYEHADGLLVMDEPTATMATADVRRLHAIVRSAAKQGVTVLYVTHRLEEVFEVADRYGVLREGVLVAEGRTAEVNRKELIHALIGEELEAVDSALAIDQDRQEGSPTLEVSELSGTTFADVSLRVSAGEIVGLAGLTGSGREEFLGAIFGASPRLAGSVHVAGRRVARAQPRWSIKAGIGLLPADRKAHGGVLDLSARENLLLPGIKSFWRFPRLSKQRERRDAAGWFDRFAVRPRGKQEQILAQFSGGNQQKILMAKWLRLEPRVLLLDEPTQGVDIAAKARIHQAIVEAAAAGRAVLVSSSDNDELVSLCTRVIVFKRGAICAHFHRGQASARALTEAMIS
jgi:ribose transport system ATP-binding protein